MHRYETNSELRCNKGPVLFEMVWPISSYDSQIELGVVRGLK